MSRLIRIAFFLLVVRPVIFVVLGMNIRGRENLPRHGPAIIAANHNSHLDTLVLMSLFPISKIHRIRPVAASDYFLRNRFWAWLALNCIGIIPFDRSGKGSQRDIFDGCHRALDAGDILVLFPEGSRGDPEKMGRIRKGIHYLVKDRKDTLITPIVMYGLGRALPKGEALLVPFNCDVVIGEPLKHADTSDELVSLLSEKFNDQYQYCLTRHEES